MSAPLYLVSKMPLGLVERLAGPPIVVDGQQMDPHSQLVNRVATRLGVLHSGDVHRQRATMDRYTPRRARSHRLDVHDETLPGPAGPIPVRVYRPRSLPDRTPCLVYFHGGGWALGSLDSHDAVTAALAERASCVVISVDYRLAPEHPYPAGHDDAHAAFLAVVEANARLQIDPERVAVGGDSAGGNLAAAVCLRCRDADGPRPCFQLLVYPATDLVGDTRSSELFKEGYLLSSAAMAWFREQLVPDRAARARPDLSPLRVPDLAGLPPAHVVIAGFDPLRDEGIAYADALRDAGVKVDLAVYPSTMHGFFGLFDALPVAERAVSRAAMALREGVQPAGV